MTLNKWGGSEEMRRGVLLIVLISFAASFFLFGMAAAVFDQITIQGHILSHLGILLLATVTTRAHQFVTLLLVVLLLQSQPASVLK